MNFTPLKAYIVTHSSSDGTLQTGDLIWWSENGNLNSCQGAGWLSPEEWSAEETNDFLFEETDEYYVEKTRYHERFMRK